MSHGSRTLHLPIPGNVRTCTRWACLQRIPGSGPDPTALTNHMERAVHAVAATVIAAAEVDGHLQATDQYVNAFLQQDWDGIAVLPGPEYPEPLLATAEERGAMCIENSGCGTAAPLDLMSIDASLVGVLPSGNRAGILLLPKWSIRR